MGDEKRDLPGTKIPLEERVLSPWGGGIKDYLSSEATILEESQSAKTEHF